jgi:hypothetical protein
VKIKQLIGFFTSKKERKHPKITSLYDFYIKEFYEKHG